MISAFEISPDKVEFIRSWLSPVFLLAILGVVSRHYAMLRKADTADKALVVQADGDALKAFADEVKALRDEQRRDRVAQREEIEQIKENHRVDMEEMRRRNTECDEDRDHLREKVSALRDYAASLYRVILQNSASKALALGDLSPEVRAAAERVDALFKKDPPSNGNPSRPNRRRAPAPRS